MSLTGQQAFPETQRALDTLAPGLKLKDQSLMGIDHWPPHLGACAPNPYPYNKAPAPLPKAS